MKNNAIKLARIEAERAKQRWVNRQVKMAKQVAAKMTSSGNYQSYDADTGQHQIKLLDGRIIGAESITNAGLQKGDRVAVSLGGRKYFKSMPRS